MKHLLQSFQVNKGIRGCHFYNEESCKFLKWMEVFQFVKELERKTKKEPFTERLISTLANYDPDKEYLAVQQSGDTVSVELYAQLHPNFYD